MAEMQYVAGEDVVEVSNVEHRRIFDKLTYWKFTKTWRFDASHVGKDHEFSSPVLRTRHEDNFNFVWRVVYSKVGRNSFLELSLLSFDKRHLEVYVRCYIEGEKFTEMLMEEREFDFNSDEPNESKFILRNPRLNRIYDQRVLASMMGFQDRLAVHDRLHLRMRADFEFYDLDQHVSVCLDLPEDMVAVLNNKEESADVTIQIGDKEFKMHKCILAARSPMFAQIFATQESPDNRYNIDDMDANVFQHLVRFIYCGKADSAIFAGKLFEMRSMGEAFGLTV